MNYCVAIVIGLLLICAIIVWAIRPVRYVYTKYPGKNSYGLDMFGGPSKLSLDNMQLVCNKDNACKGFTSTGWFKNGILPQDKWENTPTSDLYLKGNRMWI